MARNKGKQFEAVIRKCFEAVPDVSVDRIPDQTARNKGARNICDFIVYKKPHQYYIECKTVMGNRFPLSNISEVQWEGLLKKSQIKGVVAGVICWWVTKDKTLFMPIEVLQMLKEDGAKSIKYNTLLTPVYFTEIQGTKKRTYYDYDMKEFFKEVKRHAN